MLFNSIEFALFFPAVYLLYLLCSHRWQNRMLLFASYVFYGAWDWRFLGLIWFSTVLDYICGIKIDQSESGRAKKFFLSLSVAGNLSILGFFKYFDFFSQNLSFLLARFGLPADPVLLKIILPVGISFYTFQTMSYSLDIYRGKMRPTRNFPDFALFVAFFPQLVAGPIERAAHLLPQIQNPRRLSPAQFYDGCYLIFWGLFQKIFVADNLARLVDPVFGGSAAGGWQVLIALYAFAFQIFCDFAGYSNIARGLGKCMGFDIVVNFNLPYFASNPRDFWRRWHISLSGWLRDYLYVSLGGNRLGQWKTFRNILITMLLGGLWHGAAWTFVLWGLYHAALLIAHRLSEPMLQKVRFRPGGISSKIWQGCCVAVFFHCVCFGWLIFRSQSMAQMGDLLRRLAQIGNTFPDEAARMLLQLVFFTFILLAVQWLQSAKKDLAAVLRLPAPLRSVFYIVCFYFMTIWGAGIGKVFIYYQF